MMRQVSGKVLGEVFEDRKDPSARLTEPKTGAITLWNIFVPASVLFMWRERAQAASLRPIRMLSLWFVSA